MPARSVLAVTLTAGFLLTGCARLDPGEPTASFAASAGLPVDAPQREVVAAGGRILDAESVRGLVQSIGERRFVAAAGGGLDSGFTIRGDGSFCLDLDDLRTCRLVVADGRAYRLFDHTGRARGTLTPPAG
ncbi:MAG: hypothetical protein ACOCYE_01930 [Pseudomonadota bacterium]